MVGMSKMGDRRSDGGVGGDCYWVLIYLTLFRCRLNIVVGFIRLM